MKDNDKQEIFIQSDRKAKEQRMRLAVLAYERFKQHQKMYDAATLLSKKDPTMEGKLATHVSERLFEAEGEYRIFAKEALLAINELRDAGDMEILIHEGIALFSKDDGLEVFKEQLDGAMSTVKDKYPDIDTGFFEEGKQIFDNNIESVRSKGAQLHISAKSGSKRHLLILEPKPRPGHFGRIDWQQLFDVNRTGDNVEAFQSIAVADSCHHQQPSESPAEPSEGRVVDVYGSIVALLAYNRESTYWIARRTMEVGFGAFEGRDPVTAAGIIIAVIGIGCAVAGGLTGDRNLMLFGLVLLLIGAVLVAAASAILEATVIAKWAGMALVPTAIGAAVDEDEELPEDPLEDIPTSDEWMDE